MPIFSSVLIYGCNAGPDISCNQFDEKKFAYAKLIDEYPHLEIHPRRRIELDKCGSMDSNYENDRVCKFVFQERTPRVLRTYVIHLSSKLCENSEIRIGKFDAPF